ncbi:MAG: NADH-quinone oxidoreductase subunit J [Candidatus Omnitrophica bacterium]|nr:NADH-quinone oxidoreductase subunit J [Candidatus Omnitrophota bacterium]
MGLIIFLILGILSVFTAIAVVVEKRPVYSALYFIANLVVLSLIYLTLHSEFLAVVQVLIYAGAVMVLFLFVIMMMPPVVENRFGKMSFQKFLIMPLLLIFLFELVYVLSCGLYASAGKSPSSLSFENFGGIVSLGQLLFKRYLVPFEITSLILLVAIIGAVYLRRSEQ